MKFTTPAELLGRLASAPALAELAATLERANCALGSGLWGSSVSATVAALHQRLKRPTLVVCGHVDEADDLADDIELYLGKRPGVLPAVELAGSLGSGNAELSVQRLRLVQALALGGKDAPAVVVSPIQALMQSVPSKQQLSELNLLLNPGQAYPVKQLIEWLSDHGYKRLEQVEVPGDFAVRGGIVDIYLPGEFAESPGQVGMTARLDYFDDQIESIKRFSLDNLASQGALPEITLTDVRGGLPDIAASVSLLAHLDERAIIAFWQPLEIQEQARSYIDRLPDMRGIYPLDSILRLSGRFARLELSPFAAGSGVLPALVQGKEVPSVRLPVQSLQRFETDAKQSMKELAELVTTHDVAVFCSHTGEEERLAELLEQQQPGLTEKLSIVRGYLHRGYVLEVNDGKVGSSRSLAQVAHHELFNRHENRRRVKREIASRPVDSFLDLQVGDYVVHVSHGIARFTGIQTTNKDGRIEEFLTLRFADDAALHVPATRINLVQKYVGGLGGAPTLSRLGSGVWEKQKAKVGEAVMDMAAELIEVQAARAAQVGHGFPADTDWQNEFEDSFPYTATVDQLTANTEIKRDMQQPRPMDRLLCGDVGYGKTELAMRAAFKAVEAGKQVAVLVPTTVLAEQHERSFKARMSEYPFRIESVSRFKSAGEAKDILKRSAEGEVDILVGTHRLLSQDVKFKDLGLVVVDEEQRFGVTHKERLKQMRKTVDVLTMSATPIPRTLHMSLLGLRDISSLTTAPQDRRAVVTEVMTYDANRIKLAILRELQREGQIFFVHNRVQTIHETAEKIRQLVPQARIIIGHGQMEEGQLEQVMLKFIRHEADVLVSTTIIESGLDISNANTIIIDNADRFGLSELHQLRGRVGRYKNRAYCYLLIPPDRPLTEIAAKRLKAIEEYSHLGAGFKIAMRDLELRGAGNILGPEQSGHIAAVGYEMYCQLLEEATRQLKQEQKPIAPEAHVDIGLTAFLPKPYIQNDSQRMDIYRRLSRCDSLKIVAELQQATTDAFGELPRQAVVLFALTETRLLAGHYGIESIIRQGPDISLKVRDVSKVQEGLKGCPGSVRVVDLQTLYIRMPAVYNEPETTLLVLRNLLKQAYERAAPAVASNAMPSSALKVTAEALTAQKLHHAPAASQEIGLPERQTVRQAAGKVLRAAETLPQAESPTKGKVKPAKPQPPAAQPATMPVEAEQLIALRDAGVLTDSEFQVALARLIQRTKN